jgi:alanyl-tRNA synthetase
MILSSQIRKKFIEYFKSQGHRHISSSPVVPHDDPTLLFTNAGMNQFKDLFLGKSKADYTRAVSSQKCVRVGGKHNDLDNVGHTSRHMTFFEMLGNFSFGDYFKQDAIKFAFEVTLNAFEFEFEKLWVTVYKDDDEAYEIWKNYVPEKRIVRLGEKDNFWAMGDVGPCGPCSELYYDRGEKFGKASSILEDVTGERYLEFWNLVFMQYNRFQDGRLEKLPNQSIDTGSGLERVISLKMGVDTVFGTDIMQHLIRNVEKISHQKYTPTNLDLAPAFHVISDHIRSLSFAIADGAVPSNVDRGYVLRKILRRAVRYGKRLHLNEPFLAKLVPSLVDVMGDDYPELKSSQSKIQEILTLEEENFHRTLKRGGNILTSIIDKALLNPKKELIGEDLFKLKDTYGFPIEEILLIAKDTGLSANLEAYELLEEQAKERSRKAHQTTQQIAGKNIFEGFAEKNGSCDFIGYSQPISDATIIGIVIQDQFSNMIEENSSGLLILNQTPFYPEKGGQVGDSGVIEHHLAKFAVEKTTTPFPGIIVHHGKVVKGTFLTGEPVQASIDQGRRDQIKIHHTATHLLHKALQDVLGDHIKQAGSLVDADRLRFDFSHHKALSQEELKTIEKAVNQKIHEHRNVKTYEKEYEEIKSSTDIKQFFGDKYGKVVRVVDIDLYSKELCGGTHVENTKDLLLFRIVKESSIGSGVRRIEAVAGTAAIEFLETKETLVYSVSQLLEVDQQKLLQRVETLIEEMKTLKQEQKELKKLKSQTFKSALLKEKQVVKNYSLVIDLIDCDPSDLQSITQEISQEGNVDVVFLVKDSQFCLKLSKKLVEKGAKALTLVQSLKEEIGCMGGGKEDYAQGKIQHKDKIALAKVKIADWVTSL